jgi:glycosyltransferase involved in cell wall biosynthesis
MLPKSNRIVFVIHGLPMGGAEKFLITLSNHLYKRQYRPHIILLSNDDMLIGELNPFIPVYRITKKTRYDLTISKRVNILIDSIDPNIIMCVNTYAYFLTRIGQLFSNKKSIVLSPHSTIPFSLYNYFQNLIYLRFVQKSDQILYLCEAQRLFLNKTYKMPKHQNSIVYNGVDTQYFNPIMIQHNTEKSLRKTLGINPEDKVIVQVARLQKEKCHSDAIMALSILKSQKNQKSTHLIIVGTGNSSYVSALKALVQKEELNDFVHFVGSQSDVRPYLFMSDLFTLTSESETFSIAALEAMSMGLPVVLTDVGGAKEMVVSGLNGVLVRPHNSKELAEAWKTLLNSNLQSKKIRNHVIEKFSIQSMIDHYENLLFSQDVSVNQLEYA